MCYFPLKCDQKWKVRFLVEMEATKTRIWTILLLKYDICFVSTQTTLFKVYYPFQGADPRSTSIFLICHKNVSSSCWMLILLNYFSHILFFVLKILAQPIFDVIHGQFSMLAIPCNTSPSPCCCFCFVFCWGLYWAFVMKIILFFSFWL